MKAIPASPRVQMNRIIAKAFTTETDPERLFSLGLLCLMTKMLPEANRFFTLAVKISPDNPVYRSFLGLTVAIVKNEVTRGLQLCESAAGQDWIHPEVYCNLGKVYRLLGWRDKAFKAFKTGLFIDGDNEYLKSERRKIGVRRSVLFPFLKRSHPINCFAGRMRTMLAQNKDSRSCRKNSNEASMLALYDLLNKSERSLWSQLNRRNEYSLDRLWLLHL